MYPTAQHPSKDIQIACAAIRALRDSIDPLTTAEIAAKAGVSAGRARIPLLALEREGIIGRISDRPDCPYWALDSGALDLVGAWHEAEVGSRPDDGEDGESMGGFLPPWEIEDADST